MKLHQYHERFSISKKENRSHQLLIGLGILFFVFQWKFLGAALIFFGVLRWRKQDKKSSLGKDLEWKIRHEASQRGLLIPRDRELYVKLRHIHQKHFMSTQKFPELKIEFDQILDELWDNLAMSEDAQQWKWIIQETVNGWPASPTSSMEGLRQALRNASQASRNWQEAQQEAGRL